MNEDVTAIVAEFTVVVSPATIKLPATFKLSAIKTSEVVCPIVIGIPDAPVNKRRLPSNVSDASFPVPKKILSLSGILKSPWASVTTALLASLIPIALDLSR